jgi:hypothetical protein
VSPGPLPPGTSIEVENASPSRKLRFELPRPPLAVTARISNEDVTLAMKLDTVVIDGDRELLILAMRGSCPVHGKVYEVEWIDVSEEAP